MVTVGPADAASDSPEMGTNPRDSRAVDSPRDSLRTAGDATFERAKGPSGSVVLNTEPTAFFSRTYDEAIDLVEAARSYLNVLEPIDRRTLPAPDRVPVRIFRPLAWW